MSKNSADQLRMRLRSLREAIPVAERQQLSSQLCDRLKKWFDTRQATRISVGQTEPEIVAGFWPLGDEPDLRALFQHLHAQGTVITLPLMVKKNHPLEFHAWQPNDPLVRGNFGVMEPVRGAVLQPTTLLVPTLGFTSQAARIGYGGGYYDRTLAQLSQTGQPFLTIGVAWDQGRLQCEEGYQPEPHDYPLDTVLTPSGWTPKMPPA
jgi:5-formyltetrahydrofolate cyclo-ligase